MKIRTVVALAGLAISFAMPVLAQGTDTVDPKVRQQIEAALKKLEDAYNEYDAAAFAAGFTEYALELSGGGTAWGRKDIEERYASPPTSSRTPPSSHSSLCRYIQSVTTYARSGNFFIILRKRRGTIPQSMFVRAIPGRSAWPTPSDWKYKGTADMRLDSLGPVSC